MNIIFDLGRVVIDWEPYPFLEEILGSSESAKEILKHTFAHKDWLGVDRGTVELDTLKGKLKENSELSNETVNDIFNYFSILKLKPDTINLMKKLKNEGHKIYILSNMGKESIEYLESEYDFWEIVDGSTISCRVKSIKPEKEIYLELLDNYKLEPSQSIFIDDLKENISAAEALGIKGIQFTTVAECEKELLELCLI